MTATTIASVRRRPTMSLRSKIPFGLLAAAALIAGLGVLTRTPSPDEGPVAAAIDAPFEDVGIMPIEDAVQFWQGRVDAHPEDYPSRTRLAGTLMALAKETGDLSLYTKAEGVLHDALALNPVDEPSRLALASARAANHDFKGATVLAEQVLARNPSSDAARVAIADADFELGNYEQANRELAELARVLPAGPGIQLREAKQAAVEGRLDDAIRASADTVVAASELDLRPSEAAFYRFQLGHFLFQAGRLDEALDVLDAGLAIDPDHLASLEAKASVLVSLERLDDAAALYERILDRTPAADLYGELAKVDRALGRDAAADEAIAAGLALGHEQLKTYPAERRHLASFFAEFEPKTALEAAKADFGTRKDVGAYDTLAWAYFQNGQPEAAARYVDGALAQGTRDATLLYHAGMIEAAVGDPDRAAELLGDALTINPRFDLVQAPRAAATLRDLAVG